MNFFKKIFRFPSNEEKPGPKSLSLPEEQSDKININQSKPQEDAGKTSKEDIELKNYFEKYNEMNYDYLYRKVSANLDENINFVNEKTGESFDLILRRLTIVNKYQKINIAVFYLAGMSDNTCYMTL